MTNRITLILMTALALPANAAPVEEHRFDPVDAARERTVPVKVYAAKAEDKAKPAPVVLFSHGLGGSRENSSYLGKHWAESGYVAVFLQHPGSDESLWKDVPPQERKAALQKGANLTAFTDRTGDVTFVLDRLQTWNGEEGHPLYGRLDLSRVGMSGHSFGAVTTQAVMGQRTGGREPFREDRLDAFVLMSPSQPRQGSVDAAFGHIEKPVFCMTGTKDESMIGTRSHVTPASRQTVFPALPEGDKYHVVFEDGHHFIFSDRAVRGYQREPRHHEAILKMTTAFWDAYLRDDEKAKRWLQSEEAREVLVEADVWDWK